MLRVLDITAPDINNGNGIRVTMWFAGCRHHCKGCHNKWTWTYDQGTPLKELTDDNEYMIKLKEWLSKDYVEGVTLSGGDPLCQDEESLNELKALINYFRKFYPTKNIWLYTGYVYEDLKGLQKEIVDMVDVIVDGPYIEAKRDIAHTPFRGSTNQRIIYNTKKAES